MTNKLAAIAAELHGELSALGFGGNEEAVSDIPNDDCYSFCIQAFARLDRAVNVALGRGAIRQEALPLD